MRFYVAIANAQYSFRPPDEQRAIINMFMRMEPLIPAITEALHAQSLRSIEEGNHPDHGFNYIFNPGEWQHEITKDRKNLLLRVITSSLEGELTMELTTTKRRSKRDPFPIPETTLSQLRISPDEPQEDELSQLKFTETVIQFLRVGLWQHSFPMIIRHRGVPPFNPDNIRYYPNQETPEYLR
jgi:hypothetical protein